MTGRAKRTGRMDGPTSGSAPPDQEGAESADGSVGPVGPVGPAGLAGTSGCSRRDGMRRVVQLLPQITRGMRRRATLVGVDASGLGPRHSAAVSLLREHGALVVGRLAVELGLTLVTASGLVADLERAGFVERSADQADRRRTIVTLVPGRGDVIDAWLDGVTAPIERALDKLSAQERATFVKAMEYLEAELNVAPDAGTA